MKRIRWGHLPTSRLMHASQNDGPFSRPLEDPHSRPAGGCKPRNFVRQPFASNPAWNPAGLEPQTPQTAMMQRTLLGGIGRVRFRSLLTQALAAEVRAAAHSGKANRTPYELCRSQPNSKEGLPEAQRTYTLEGSMSHFEPRNTWTLGATRLKMVRGS